MKQLQAYDKAFGEFFTRLAADKITVANTLFVITADENDHFAGGLPSPGNCDGVTIPCTYAKIGEIDIDLSQLMATEFGEESPFTVHSDDAPTFYINGIPGQLTSLTRRFEREAAGLTAVNSITGNTDVLTQAMADQQQQTFLHMVTTDPNRTPNFIMFANPDYFLSATGNTAHCIPLASCSRAPGVCVGPRRLPNRGHQYLAGDGRAGDPEYGSDGSVLLGSLGHPPNDYEPRRIDRRLCP